MSGRRSTAAVGFFAASIFGAAFLIFAVQPMVGKHILPWFGGTPGVWLICLAFYQSALFLGYAYAYWLIAKIPAKRQALIHGAILVAATLVLPVLPGDGWKPEGAEAASGLIFGMLVANVALPFVWLASTGLFDDLAGADPATREQAMGLLDGEGMGEEIRVLVQARETPLAGVFEVDLLGSDAA